MNTFGIMQATISHNLKDPHSKALEPDCLSPRIAITTQSLKGRGITTTSPFKGECREGNGLSVGLMWNRIVFMKRTTKDPATDPFDKQTQAKRGKGPLSSIKPCRKES